jgi:SAM-dependent methyltransferase
MLLIVITVIMLSGAAFFIHSMFYGAPFLPAKRLYVERALDLLNLEPGQKLLELGSGDGRVLTAAARRGIYATGYEINPLLYLYSWLRCRPYRSHIRLIRGNYWQQPFPDADGIYTYLLKPYMVKLDQKLCAEVTKPTKLLSFIFRIDGKKPIKQSEGMNLYQY